MKILITIISLIAINMMMFAGSKDQTDKRVNELLNKMTLEEKVGQMTQVTMEAISKQQGNKNQDHILDMAKLEKAVLQIPGGFFTKRLR